MSLSGQTPHRHQQERLRATPFPPLRWQSALHARAEPAAGNYWGIAPGSFYGYPKQKLLATGAPDEILVDLYMHQPSRFNIVGGSLGVEGAGDTAVRHNVVIAGLNTTAVDAVGAVVMGFDPEKLPLLEKLERRGLGMRDIYSIWTRGNEAEQVRREFRKPAGWEKA